MKINISTISWPQYFTEIYNQLTLWCLLSFFLQKTEWLNNVKRERSREVLHMHKYRWNQKFSSTRKMWNFIFQSEAIISPRLQKMNLVESSTFIFSDTFYGLKFLETSFSRTERDRSDIGQRLNLTANCNFMCLRRTTVFF